MEQESLKSDAESGKNTSEQWATLEELAADKTFDREIGQTALDQANLNEPGEYKFAGGETKMAMPKNAWYRYEDLDYNTIEYNIVPKLERLSRCEREEQNRFFTELAKESDSDNVAFIQDIMHGEDSLLYEEYDYDGNGPRIYYDFVQYLSEEQHWEDTQGYRQFLDWYQERMQEKVEEFSARARDCEQKFQHKLNQRMNEGLLPKEYAGGLSFLQEHGVEYQICDMIDSQTEFFDGPQAFGAMASTAHCLYNFNLSPSLRYNLTGDPNFKKIWPNLEHEFLHLVGGNIGIVSYEDAVAQAQNQHEEEVIVREQSDAKSIFEEGAVEVARGIMESGEKKIMVDGVYGLEKQVLDYLCEESYGEITIDDILLAHAGRSHDRREQRQLTQKISSAFPWWSGERGVMGLLIERRIWFGQERENSKKVL